MEDSSNTPVDDNFTIADVELVSREIVYSGFFKVERLSLKHRLFNGGWSPAITREVFVRGDAVAAIVYDPIDDTVCLIRQFRAGAIDIAPGPWLTEVIAGMTEEGETPEDVIIRELHEEAGVRAIKLLPICEYMTSPGGTSEKLTLFCALADLREVGGCYGLDDEGEDIYAQVLPAQPILEDIYTGKLNNAATLICLQWLQAHRDGLRMTYTDRIAIKAQP